MMICYFSLQNKRYHHHAQVDFDFGQVHIVWWLSDCQVGEKISVEPWGVKIQCHDIITPSPNIARNENIMSRYNHPLTKYHQEWKYNVDTGINTTCFKSDLCSHQSLTYHMKSPSSWKVVIVNSVAGESPNFCIQGFDQGLQAGCCSTEIQHTKWADVKTVFIVVHEHSGINILQVILMSWPQIWCLYLW